MKNTLFAAACALACLAAPAAAQPGDAGRPERTVTADGEAEVRVAPDEVVITLGVETFDADLQKAKADNDARVAAVLAAARERRIPDERARTDYLQIEPSYHNGNNDRLVTAGYIVRRTIVVTLRDVPAFDAFLGAALAAGATHVHGADFRTTELRAHRDRARGLALDAAREKAAAMAARLGKRIGDPIAIQEVGAGWWSGYGGGWGRRYGGMSQNVVQNAAGGAGGAPEGPNTPGQIAVTGRVTVTFELVP